MTYDDKFDEAFAAACAARSAAVTASNAAIKAALAASQAALDRHAHDQAQCPYCGRFGALGQCQGCGAANQPIRNPRRIEITCHNDTHRRYLELPKDA
jgi:hypothetical protein